MENIHKAPDKVEIPEMRRNWWIKYNWICVREVGLENPFYIRSGLRPIEEAGQAARDFDLFIKNFKSESQIG